MLYKPKPSKEECHFCNYSRITTGHLEKSPGSSLELHCKLFQNTLGVHEDSVDP